MQKSEIWMIKPVKPPAVRRQCPGCGKGLYESTGRFRVNANGNRLDVWLIYRCMQCGKLSEEKLLKYQENDEEEALRAAYSNFLMNQNRVEVLWETLEYEVEKSGREELMQEPHRISDQAAVIVIRIRNEYGLPIRFGRLLAGELGISGGKVKTLVETGKIRLPEGMTLKSKISVTAQTGLCIYLEDLGGTG